MVKDVEEKTFQQEVLLERLPVLAYFQSEWCPSCRSLAPLVDKLSASMEDLVKVVKIDAIKDQKLAVDHAVLSTPTLIIFKEGKEVKRNLGFLGEGPLRSFVEKHL
ncbi:MAG: thioredoxin domain-containing protein [Candidatus Eremiobacteraeota bacterium]|nr:thioredoxin domain-containing protein [Candidatus Eremiobacteraeota bacterium]